MKIRAKVGISAAKKPRKVLVGRVAGKLGHELGNNGEVSQDWVIWRHGLLKLSECAPITGVVLSARKCISTKPCRLSCKNWVLVTKSLVRKIVNRVHKRTPAVYTRAEES